MIPNQPIINRQSTNLEIICFRVDVSEVIVSPTAASNRAALPEGFDHAIVTKNATGEYIFTLTIPGLRSCAVVGVAPVGTSLVYHAATVSASAVQIHLLSPVGTPTDADFHVTLAVFRTKAVY